MKKPKKRQKRWLKRSFIVGGVLVLMYVSAVVGHSAALWRTNVLPEAPTAPITAQKPDVYELYLLTNIERVKASQAPLNLSPLLNAAAQDKCNDMVARNYWAHLTPYGKDHTAFVKKYMPKANGIGENLSISYTNSTEVVIGWMGSPTHKENIVRPNFTEVGFAVCDKDNKVVQMLVAKP